MDIMNRRSISGNNTEQVLQLQITDSLEVLLMASQQVVEM